jgi:hypothetical protein
MFALRVYAGKAAKLRSSSAAVTGAALFLCFLLRWDSAHY